MSVDKLKKEALNSLYKYQNMSLVHSGLVNSRKFLREDINLNCKEMALYLLGKILVRKLDDNSILKAKIVETECYLGADDKASKSYGNRKTPSNEPMFMDVGTTYVYMTYGMYHCFNISSKEPGAAVLLRALEPIEGTDIMQGFRKAKRKRKVPLKQTELCAGPSKLCMSMDITRHNCNKLDITDNDSLWLEESNDSDEGIRVVETSRIGIDSAGEEWAKKPLRFYIFGNMNVSKRDRTAEKQLDLEIHEVKSPFFE